MVILAVFGELLYFDDKFFHAQFCGIDFVI